MPNRLEPLNLRDFTGGLALRRNQFQLAENESPEMLNVDVDPRGGVQSRRGWDAWSAEVDNETWEPRSAFLHTLSGGTDLFYVTNDGLLLHADGDGVFADAEIVAAGTPQIADFAAWGDTVYIACGKGEQSVRRVGAGAFEVRDLASTGSWNENYDLPTDNKLPSAEFFETHLGYLFAANIDESGTTYANRVRWSHSDHPEDWSEFDFQDVLRGGNRITGIMSLEDHLLVFKRHAIWALFGYDAESWQWVEISGKIGAPHTQGITKSESAIYFYASHPSPGVYAYDGEQVVEVSEPLREAFEEITAHENVFLGWVNHRLWVTVPWGYDGATSEPRSVFVFDPSVGNGAWCMYDSAHGTPGPYFNEQGTQPYPLAALSSEDTPVVVRLEAVEEGFDTIGLGEVLGTLDGEAITWGPDDIEILLLGTGTSVPPTVYRTPWLDAGWPTRRKSWRRPDFVCREYGSDYALLIESYRDHRETEVSRQQILNVTGVSGSGGVWGEFEWGDGTEWGEAEQGAVIERGSSFGIAKALQLRIKGPTNLPNRWGIEAIVMKFVNRRFR